jgi:DnaJ-domain-containing protein 1
MFDRIFNILKANLGNTLHKDDFTVGDKTVDEIYAEYLQKMKEDEQKASQFSQHTYQTPPNYQQQNPTQKPPFSAEELEAFKVLEVKVGANFEEIKVAYKALIKKYHPDKFHNDPVRYKTALELSQKINKAYNTLEIKYGK